MNIGNAVNQASSAASKAATNAVSGTSALKPDTLPKPNPNIPQNSNALSEKIDNITDFLGDNNPIMENLQGADIIDFPENDYSSMDASEEDDIIDFSDNEDVELDSQLSEQALNPEGPQPGDKVDFGKEINEEGEVEKTATRKATEAIGRVILTYLSGGQATGSGIADLKPIDKALGVVSDTLDKTPGVKQLTEALDEFGLADGVNDALDTLEKAKSGDIKGAVDSAKNLKQDVDKFDKKSKKAVMKTVITIAVPIIVVVVVIITACGPVLGGFLDVVEGNEQTAENYGGSGVSSSITPILGDVSAINMLNEIPGYDSLSSGRQAILAAAASAVANGTPYKLGGHPTGGGFAGIPSSGLDCAGFVQWSLWTGLGNNPGYLTTQTISDKIGSDFIQISPENLQPGDIGLKRRGGSSGDNYNHTGIYAGNGQWFHAAGSKSGVIRSNYSSFTIYLRYKGVS